MMILFNGPNTPFGRLALTTALELGIEVENRVVDINAAEFLDALNPLRQIPTLVPGDDNILFDSRVICAFFSALRPNADFAPPADWVVQTRWSLTLGLMEASVARTMELRRPASERNMAAVTRQERRVERAIAALEAEAADLRDKLLRALAETENVRRRGQRDREEASKYAISSFAREMAVVADNLRRALEAVSADALTGDARAREAEAIVGIESRGFLFGAPLADRLELPFIPVRKPGKLPSTRQSMEYSLEYGESRLDIHQDALRPGARAYVVDDLLATGGTALATAKLVEVIGGVVAGLGFAVELEALGGRARLDGYVLYSVITY